MSYYLISLAFVPLAKGPCSGRILFLILSHSRLSLGNGRGWPVSSLVESGFSLQSSDRDSRLYKAIPTGQLSSQIDFTKHYSYEFMRELCQR